MPEGTLSLSPTSRLAAYYELARWQFEREQSLRFGCHYVGGRCVVHGVALEEVQRGYAKPGVAHRGAGAVRSGDLWPTGED